MHRTGSGRMIVSVSIVAGGLLCVILSSFTVGAFGQVLPRGPVVRSRQVAGAGDWQSSRDGQGKRQWQLQLKRGSDGSLGGRIHVVGSNDIRDARIEGRVEEGGVYGVLVGDRDVQIGTFTGAVTAAGAAGTYTFKSGDSGNWNWNDPGAARELKGEE